MHGVDEQLNFIASLWATVTGAVFVLVYGFLAPRWRFSFIGRSLMTMAGAIMLLCLNVVIYYSFGIDVFWVRLVRAFLVAVVGTMIFFLTITVVRQQMKGEK